MKLFKRFFLLKKGIGAAAAAALLAFSSCENMTTIPAPTMVVTATKTLYAPTFPEKTDENGNPISNLTYGERYYTVSQGLKRKISLSWNPVEIAKYYEIFAAQNINDTFVKVGESTKAEFEDNVASGMTYYYKVRAVNTTGEFSDFSATVRGTSLATPAITEISITDTEAKVFWYMGNAGIDSYVKNLVYEIHAFKGSDETTVTLKAWDEANQSVIEEYTFENLSGNSEYMFRVDAYVTSDQTQIESSPKVSEKTLALYTPVSPEFAASQGESVESVKLAITLPPKVQVALDKDTNEDFPICFEIQRKRSDEQNWGTIIPCLYFTGKTDKPAKADYSDYAEGKVTYWEDKVSSSAASVIRGIKYDYRIVSCVDLNYAKVNTIDYNTTVKSKEALAKTATGWIAFNPKFEIKNISRILKDSDTVAKVNITFESSWNALGKDDLYKFAIQQTFQKDGTNVKGTSWLKKKNADGSESDLFDNAADVNAYIAEYDLSIGAEFLTGVYQFALYIIPKEYTDPAAAVSGGNYLAYVADLNNVTITPDANVPNTDIMAEGGWPNKTEVSWFTEKNVNYSLKRTDISGGGTETTIDQATILAGLGLASFPINEKITFTDTTVAPGHEYAYDLVAVRNARNYTSSMKAHAKTLGTAAITFGATAADYSYDTVKVSWPVVMAAKTYDITLGESDKFGGGKTVSLNEDGSIQSSNFDADSVESKLESDTITLTIKNPKGYDDALLSGSQANLTVNSNSNKATTTKPEPVWTIGPASAATRASDDNGVDDDSIIVKWKGVKGAAGYAVYRTRQAIQGSTEAGEGGTKNLEDQKTDVYYISADKNTITANGEAPTSGAVSVAVSDSNYDFNTTYTLTDKYHSLSDNTKKWQVSQSYIGLGIKYNYTVLPVLKEDDAKDVEALDDSAWSNSAVQKMVCPKYKNLNNESIKKDGYTMGYGLNLEATKAEYTDRVVLMWDKPANIEKRDRHPIIYYRKRGSSVWNKIVDAANGLGETSTSTYTKNYYVFNSWARLQALDSSFDPALDVNGNKAIREAERLKSFEFVVSYNSSFGGTSGIDTAYINYLGQLQDKRITDSETKNVGYLFTIPGVSGSRVENADYSETVTWQKYNAMNSGDEERAVEPDSYAISLKNLNNGSGYKTLVTYDKEADKNDAKITNYANITIQTDGQLAADRTVKVTPSFNTTNDVGVHNGLLKVQRDYKHWYRLTASRKSKQDCYKFGDIKDNDFEAPDDEITTGIEDWACRKISDQEFAKCIGLIICDAINQAGVPDGKSSSIGGVTGSFSSEHNGGTKTYIWNANNYQHIFRSGNVGCKGVEVSSGWTINCSARNRGASDGNDLYHITTGDTPKTSETEAINDNKFMNVTHELSTFDSYNGKVKFTMGAHGSLGQTLLGVTHEWVDGTTTSYNYSFIKGTKNIVSVSGEANFKKYLWFPFEMGSNHKDKYTSYNASLPEYQGTWWQEQ